MPSNIKKLIIFGIISLFLVLYLPRIDATIDGRLFKVQDNTGSPVIVNEFTNAEAKFYFSNDENVDVIVNSNGEYSFDPSEFYCWNSCNIYPKIYLKGIGISEDNNYLGSITIPFSNELPKEMQELGLFTNFFTSEKVNNPNPILETANIDNGEVPTIEVKEINNKTFYSVLWNGNIIIPQEAEYTFFVTISGKFRIWIDGNLVFDDLINGTETSFTYNLIAKNYSLQLEYYTSDEFEPNLYWSYNSVDKELVPDENLIFISGGTKKVTGPLEMKMRSVSATSFLNTDYPKGTWYYYGTMDTSKRPILFVHGWTNTPVSAGNCGYWGKC